MASSAKKKKEKQKDFQKTKLKVGKTKPKAANFTDTSFKAKSITVLKQSLSTTAPTATKQFSHHLSLLNNKSDAQCAESLAYLTTAIASNPDGTLPEPTSEIVNKVKSLLISGSPAVRRNALSLLKSLRGQDFARHAADILTFVHIGMTHLAADIRSFAMEPLEWLLGIVPEEVVSCPGGWAKTLAAFIRSLAWKKSEGSVNGWTSHRDAGVRPAKETQARTRQMNVLASFIRAGIAPPSPEDLAAAEAAATSCFPYVGLRQNLLPERSNAYAHLHLFGPPPDEENEMYQDRKSVV